VFLTLHFNCRYRLVKSVFMFGKKLIEDRGVSKNGMPRNLTEALMATKHNASQTVAEQLFNIGKRNGFSPVSALENESDYTIAAQAEQIRNLQTLLTEERFKNAKLLVLADGLMDIIAKHDIPLSESESAA
jgi:hypothetical protein